jgi:hypothetical protein
MADTELSFKIDANVGEVTKDVKGLVKETEKIGPAANKGSKGFQGLGTAIKGVGGALKAAGIALAVALLAKLMEVFSKNQKVLDTFNTAMTALSIAFNDLFSFIGNNVGTVTGWFKDIFENPKQALIDFGNAIKENLIERFNSLLDTFGHLGKALSHLVKGEFAEAMDATKAAYKESIDIYTGVDNSVDKLTKTIKTATTAAIDYTKSTLDQASAITESEKAARAAGVEFAMLNAQFLKDAELQRQIRDDETKTFAERIEANQKLDKILAEQQKLQKEALQKQVDAAFKLHELDKTNLDNKIAYQEALVAQAELEETITGQLSEQKTNQVALEKELLEVQNEIRAEGMSGIERELEELEAAYKLKLDMADKSGMAIEAITKQYEKQKEAIVWSGVESQLSAYSSLTGALGKLAGENKALAVAQAVMDTYAAANSILNDSAFVGPARFAAAAAAIVTGLANVKQIMATPVPGGGGGGAVPGAGAQTPAPQTMGGSFDLRGGTAPEPVQAYVVSDDITNNQDKLAAIRRRATI